MRGIVSKKLMKEARLERSMEREVPDRDLAQKRSGAIINHPYSVRATYLSMKKMFSFVARFSRSVVELRAELLRMGGEAVEAVRRGRKVKAAKSRPQLEDRIITIQNPLMLILQHCQPMLVTDRLTGGPRRDPITGEFEYEPHPVYAAAKRAAARGRGDLVKKMAAQFLPA